MYVVSWDEPRDTWENNNKKIKDIGNNALERSL